MLPKRRALLMLAVVTAMLAAVAQGKPRLTDSRDWHRRPTFCNDLDCPDYDVCKDYGNHVELRRYEPSTWAYTDVNEWSFEKATATGFQRLFGYIIGNNELEVRIDMTAPVVTTLRLNDDDEFKEDQTVAFFLPYEYQKVWDDNSGTRGRMLRNDWPRMDNTSSGDPADASSRHRKRRWHREAEPPAPRDDRVSLIDIDEFDAFVLPFDGYALGFRVRRLALDFMSFLDRTVGKRFDRSLFLVAVYDPPYKPFDRHNEIWVLRKWKKCCKKDALRGDDEDDDCDDDCETCGGGDSPDTS